MLKMKIIRYIKNFQKEKSKIIVAIWIYNADTVRAFILKNINILFKIDSNQKKKEDGIFGNLNDVKYISTVFYFLFILFNLN